MKHASTLTDRILYDGIGLFLTPDEWHTAVVGFFDGLSFSDRGRYMRRALTRPGLDVENIDTEKVWYYQVPYTIGEICKAIAVYFLITNA